jgi:arginine repressor
VARALDHAGDSEEVIGTVAGDDTIFVATPSPGTAEEIAERWSVAAGIKKEVSL